MPKKRFSAEQIVTLLRQIEVLIAQGKSAPEACREAGISQQSYYRWRKEYGGLEIDQARRMKDLERENVRLKRLVADLSLEKQVFKDIASGSDCLGRILVLPQDGLPVDGHGAGEAGPGGRKESAGQCQISNLGGDTAPAEQGECGVRIARGRARRMGQVFHAPHWAGGSEKDGEGF